jgi:hypothetical protein
MNWKRVLIATVVGYIIFEVMSFLIHGVLLMEAYAALPGLWRPEMQSYMPFMYIGDLIFNLFFVIFFAKGYEGKGLMEGVRFGLYVSALTTIPGMLAQFAVYPVTTLLTSMWIVTGVIQMVILGIVVSLIYKPEQA